ncbi:MAG: YiiD C-terminal domain-containing protein [Balneolaceae bacterium]|nr:YiiD C-terminal domain-containing protein [Balneolaceae bacterium]
MTEKAFEDYLKTHIPIAWEAGVRLQYYSDKSCSIAVTLGRMNQNPFGSMFWAVEGMAAEFAGGIMLLNKIQDSGISISTLVIDGTMEFYKKAVGTIIFTCSDGNLIDQQIDLALCSKEAQTLELTSVGWDEAGDQVARFTFQWSIKVRAED